MATELFCDTRTERVGDLVHISEIISDSLDMLTEEFDAVTVAEETK